MGDVTLMAAAYQTHYRIVDMAAELGRQIDGHRQDAIVGGNKQQWLAAARAEARERP
jgi:hypothetical protein